MTKLLISTVRALHTEGFFVMSVRQVSMDEGKENPPLRNSQHRAGQLSVRAMVDGL